MGSLGSSLSLFSYAVYFISGIVSLFLWIVIIAALRKNSAKIYVLKAWSATTTPTDGEGTYVRILGRRPGIVAWLLARLGVDPTVTFSVTAKNVIHEAGAWSGHERKLIPIRHVNCFESGSRRPWLAALVIAALLAPVLGGLSSLVFTLLVEPAGSMPVLLVGFLIGLGLALAYYMLNKTLRIQVNAAAHSAEISFRRSVIENQTIDEAAAARVVAIIQTLVDQQRAR